MKVTAFVFGSLGDILPFINLGKELVRRNHQFAIATFSEYKDVVQKENILFKQLHGEPKEFVKILLSESDGKSETGIQGIRYLLGKYSGLFDDLDSACRDSELILYNQFGALAYHFAEKYNLKCIRTFVFPMDATKMYSAMVPIAPRNTFRCKISYKIFSVGMNFASINTVNEYRKKLGLSKWHLFSNYKKLHGKDIDTLYQYSGLLAPRDPIWKKHIHITGSWESEISKFEPEKDLEEFLEHGSKPIYFGFGSMVYSKISKLQERILEALKITGQRAIFNSSWSQFKQDNNPNIYYSGYIPFSWLFKRVKAVVHHGGSGTVHLGIRYAKPTLIIAFGADQLFWGQQIEQLGLGPKPIDIRNDEISVSLLADRIRSLEQESFESNAIRFSRKMSAENGVETACNIIEDILGEKGGLYG